MTANSAAAPGTHGHTGFLEKQSFPRGISAIWWKMTTALHGHITLLCIHNYTHTRTSHCLGSHQENLTCASHNILSVLWKKVRGGSDDEHLLCPPFILFLSLLWAVIDLICFSLNWSHDSCCSDWPSLTTHRHSSVMLAAIYLSICLCLLPRSALRQVNLLTTKGLYVAVIINIGIFAVGIVVLGAFL